MELNEAKQILNDNDYILIDEARNSGWAEEDSEMFAANLDADTSLEEIKDLLREEPYFEENPDEIDEVADEIFDLL